MSGSPGVLAVDRTRGRVWGKLQKGTKPRRATARRSCREFGRKLGFQRDRRVNGFSEGAKLRSGRSGYAPASPMSRVDRQGHITGQLEFWSWRSRLSREALFPPPCRAVDPRGSAVRLGRGARWKAIATNPKRRVDHGRGRTRKGARRPPQGGTALREGKALKGESQGRCGMKQGRKTPGRAPTRAFRGNPGRSRRRG
jgi:hypothetical protein